MNFRVGRGAYLVGAIRGTLRESAIVGAGPLTLGYNSASNLTINRILRDVDPLVRGKIGDVGWASIIAQMGLAGAFSLIWLLARILGFALHCFSQTREEEYRAMFLGLAGATVGFFVLGFASSPFESRYPAFYYWVLTGVVMGIRPLVLQTGKKT